MILEVVQSIVKAHPDPLQRVKKKGDCAFKVLVQQLERDEKGTGYFSGSLRNPLVLRA